jgi:hypothetical protein
MAITTSNSIKVNAARWLPPEGARRFMGGVPWGSIRWEMSGVFSQNAGAQGTTGNMFKAEQGPARSAIRDSNRSR